MCESDIAICKSLVLWDGMEEHKGPVYKGRGFRYEGALLAKLTAERRLSEITFESGIAHSKKSRKTERERERERERESERKREPGKLSQ